MNVRPMGRFALASLLLAGCAAKMPVAELAVPEVILETIPSGAQLSVAGGTRSVTPAVVPVRSETGEITVEFQREGFHPRSVSFSAEELRSMAGQRVLVVLSPSAFEAAAKPIEPDDVGQLGRAGVLLVKLDRCPEALQFFRQALQLDPRLPVAHKGMGTRYARQKKNKQALEAYKQYLLFAPDAPDAARVREIVSRAEGDITLPQEK